MAVKPNTPNDSFDYEMHEARLEEAERRMEQERRFYDYIGPNYPNTSIDTNDTNLEDEEVSEEPDYSQPSVIAMRDHVVSYLKSMYRLRLDSSALLGTGLRHHKEGEYVLWSEIQDFIDSLIGEDEMVTPYMLRDEEGKLLPAEERRSCPICGERITITGTTTDGRLIGSCKDAFTRQQWEK
jgi:hypothetical protein